MDYGTVHILSLMDPVCSTSQSRPFFVPLLCNLDKYMAPKQVILGIMTIS
jgi:hypothetical protein